MKSNTTNLAPYLKILIVVLLFSLLVNTGAATEYYVSATGDDTNLGFSLDEPWNSPSFAVSKAQAGDTIYLLNGTWYDEHISFSNSGTSSEKIVLKAYNGTPVLDGLDMSGDAIRVWDVSYIEINGIDVRNYKRMMNIHDASYITIDNCYLHDTNTGSIFQFDRNVSYSSIINCEIYNQSGGFNALELNSGPIGSELQVHDIEISNNHIHDITGHNAINFAAKYNPAYERVIWNVTVSNNVFHDNYVNSYSIATNVITLYDSVVSGNLIYDSQRGISIYSENVTFSDNTVNNIIDIPEVGNVGGITYNATFIKNNADLELNTIRTTVIEPLKDIRISGASSLVHVQDAENDQKITMIRKSAVELIQTDNSIFTIDMVSGSTSYEQTSIRSFPEKSNASIKMLVDTATIFNIDNLPISFIPLEGYLDIVVESDSSFIVSSSVSENPINIVVNNPNIANKNMELYVDGIIYDEEIADSEGFVSFYYNRLWGNEHTFTLVQTSESSTSESASTGISFIPSASSVAATVSESTSFTVDSGQDFTSALWYLNGNQVKSDSVSYVQNWDTAGVHTVVFDGTAVAGTISRTWTVVVSESEISEASAISISPSSTVVEPGDSFTIDVYIDPTQSLTGSQFDLYYSQLASVSSANEGDLFTLSNLSTTFGYESIDNTIGILNNVYSAILGCGTISTPGTMTTINMVAGSNTGILEIGLAGVILSDADSNPAPCAGSNATVLIDTAPEFVSISEQSVDEEQNLGFTICATDRDGDDLTYSATSLPNGASFNTGTATFSWTPLEEEAGTYTAMFEVTDGYLIDSMSVPITVNPLNHAPVISFFEPSDAASFEEGSIVNVNVAATDEDEQSLSYVIKIDDLQVATGPNYTWNVNYESAGTHTIEVIVSDGIDDVRATSTITIIDLHPRWDVNEDGIVNVLDVTLVAQNYGTTYAGDLPRYDVNQDGTINIQDLSVVAGHFGEIL